MVPPDGTPAYQTSRAQPFKPSSEQLCMRRGGAPEGFRALLAQDALAELGDCAAADALRASRPRARPLPGNPSRVALDVRFHEASDAVSCGNALRSPSSVSDGAFSSVQCHVGGGKGGMESTIFLRGAASGGFSRNCAREPANHEPHFFTHPSQLRSEGCESVSTQLICGARQSGGSSVEPLYGLDCAPSSGQ